MENVNYFAHLSFVKEKREVPWVLTLTSTDDSLTVWRFGYDRSRMMFSEKDVRYNISRTDDFMHNFKLDFELNVQAENFGKEFRALFMRDFFVDGWNKQIGAVDAPTYKFLLEWFYSDEVVFLEEQEHGYLGEVRTFAAAAKFRRARNKRQLQERAKDVDGWY